VTSRFTPEIVRRLQQVLDQEARGGFQDRAVIGGLDRFLSNSHAAGDGDPPLPRPSYRSLTPERRGDWAQQFLLWLAGATVPSTTPVEHLVKRTAAPVRSTKATGQPKTTPARVAVVNKAPARAKSQSQLSLSSPFASVKGVRKDVAERLAKLGVETIEDALYFFPRRHLDFSHIKPIASLMPGPEETASGFIWEVREVSHGPRRRGTELVLGDETGNIRAVWFNQPYLAKTFQKASRIVLSGRVGIFRGQKVFEAPEYEIVDSEDADLTHTGRLVPVYPLTVGLSGRTVRRLVKDVVETWAPQKEDPLPLQIQRRRGFMPLPQALLAAHYPDSAESYDQARRRLAFDELFALQIAALRKRREWQTVPGYPIAADKGVLEGFRASLPFSFTRAQERVLAEILDDLSNGQPMSRLLQGDVGSGKTVLAASALVLAVAAGHQGAFMAPTELLAEQHYRNLSLLFGHTEFEVLEYLPLPYLEKLGRPLRVGLLTGSLRPAEKQRLQQDAASGQIDILVGTHALIQEGVSFQSLGVAVIDEQHRFGVAQRAALRQKGRNPHLLVMTATPIPRTLALTLYGDLDSSILDELPPGRQPIRTHIVGPKQREQTYRFLQQQAQEGRQAYVICPLIEESAVIEAKAATVEHDRLSREVFPQLRLGLLHGRMSPADKDEVMGRFREGALDILVSTSVIEVGIDVPNATVMLIEGADRFGLSQLHQLRGRVGRGQHQSYCFLLSDTLSEEAQERLNILAQTTDGFRLAEEDLRLRGPGEYFGTRQTGLPDLRMARLDDWEILTAAREEAQLLLDDDPDLKMSEHQGLRTLLNRLRPLSHAELS